MDALIQDLRYALRQLRRSPGYTLVAVLTLALGIGANSTMFTVLDRVLLRPLPGVREADRLMTISRGPASYPAFRDVRDAMQTASVAAWRNRQFVWSDGAASSLVTGHVVSGNYFDVLGVRPLLGRVLNDLDDRTGRDQVAVVSQRFWLRSLNADPGVIGRKVVLNGAPVVVVGVASTGFGGLLLTSPADLWVPIHAWPALAPSGYARLDIERRGWGWLTVIGRLAPTVSLGQARSEASLIQQRLFTAYPGQDARTGTTYAPVPAAATATGLEFEGRAAVVTFVVALMGVVGLVLLITCANVANLALARTASRRKEMTVRLALGAGNHRLLRQMLTESLVLAAFGACAALLLASLGAAALSRVTLPGGVSLAGGDLSPDVRVLGFTAVVALFASLLSGLAPAIQAARTDVTGRLRDEMMTAIRGDRLRYFLVSVQVALCVVVASGAGLFARGLARALSIPPGFRTEHVAMATAYPGLTRIDSAAASRYLDESVARITARPGVRAAAWTTLVPLVGEENTLSFAVPGYTPRPEESMTTEAAFVGPDFFRVLDVAIVSGRSFRAEDRGEAPPVVIVSETMARRYWPAGDPVGQAMNVDSAATVVGVAKDVRWRGLVGDAPPIFYLPFAQRGGGVGDSELTLLVHTEGEPAQVLTDTRDVLRSVNPDVPVGDLGTFDDTYAALLAPQRTGAAFLSGFSALALLLAAVGIAGVVAHGVTQRRREIGIRIALGAGTIAVQQLAVRASLISVIVGLGVGLFFAALSTRAISSFLYGVSPTDLATFAATSLLLACVALVAAWLPARNATRVDPMVALRSE